MVIQLFVIILACVAASLFALTIAGVSLSAFCKVLRRAEDSRDKEEM